MNQCPNCGHTVSGDNESCPNCGQSLSRDKKRKIKLNSNHLNRKIITLRTSNYVELFH